MSTQLILTPHKIRFLLHIYAIAEPLDESRATEDAIKYFINQDMIKYEDNGVSGYKITPKGEYHVHALCALPLPEIKVTTTYITPSKEDNSNGN